MRMQRCVGFLSILAVTGSSFLGAAWLCAQSPSAWPARIDLLRSQIKTGEEQHASAAQMGDLWLQLANRYQDQLQLPEAEDAFVRSLRLLKGTGDQAKLADALDGMGSLYLATGRLNDAVEFTQKALKIYDTLGDSLPVAKMHEDLAIEFLFQKRYREAESESAEGVARMHALIHTPTTPDAGEMVAVYLTHGVALCNLRRYNDALEDANQAMEIVQQRLSPESLDMVAATLIRGYVQWKSGSQEQADQSMREAIRIARELKNLPQPVMVNTQLAAMEWYQKFLKDTHQKQEAKEMELELGRVRASLPPSCAGCTVNVAAFAPASLLP